MFAFDNSIGSLADTLELGATAGEKLILADGGVTAGRDGLDVGLTVGNVDGMVEFLSVLRDNFITAPISGNVSAPHVKIGGVEGGINEHGAGIELTSGDGNGADFHAGFLELHAGAVDRMDDHANGYIEIHPGKSKNYGGSAIGIWSTDVDQTSGPALIAGPVSVAAGLINGVHADCVSGTISLQGGPCVIPGGSGGLGGDIIIDAGFAMDPGGANKRNAGEILIGLGTQPFGGKYGVDGWGWGNVYEASAVRIGSDATPTYFGTKVFIDPIGSVFSPAGALLQARDQIVSDTKGWDFEIHGANGEGTGTGGWLCLFAGDAGGDAGGDGGDVYLTTGRGATVADKGGLFEIRTPSTLVGDGASGLIRIETSDSSTTAGNIDIFAGTGVTTDGKVRIGGGDQFGGGHNPNFIVDDTGLRFFDDASPTVGIQTIVGAKGGNAALASVIAAMVAMNIAIDTSGA